ncbi:MAG: hypothetical protein FJZ12_00350 [Candidatus Omnitrophica bacterium]|nr:hypothetical protein [Candidatus Omnitrophota bacterium]
MRFLKFALFILVLYSLSGCSGMKEITRGFCGTSTKVLEDTRKDAVVRDFNADFETIRINIKSALKENKSYIYRENTSVNLIAVYISEQDTTPVGIFLTALDIDNTRVEISSPSTYGKEVIAKIIFNSLKGISDGKKE